MKSVIRGAGYVLAHTPDMVLHNGTTQTTERIVNPDSEYLKELPSHIRSFEQAVAYWPNQVYIGNKTPEQIVAAVEKAGYGAGLKQKGGAAPQPAADPLKDTQTPKLLRRLISSVVFLLILMYFSMGHMMWNWPLPSVLEGNHMAWGCTKCC